MLFNRFEASGNLRQSVQDLAEHLSGIRFVLVGRFGLVNGSAPDPGTLALTADDQGLVTEHGECALHGAQRDPVLLAEVSLLGKALTWSEHAFMDGGPQVVSNLQVRRLRIIRIDFSHVSEGTDSRKLNQLDNIALTRLSNSSSVPVVPVVAGGFTSSAGHDKAPAVLQHQPGLRTATVGEAMQFEGTRMYRVKAVAEMLDVSVNTIYRAIESGQLDAIKLGTGKGTLRISGSALNAYFEECAQAAYSAYVLGTASAAEADEQAGEVA